MSHGFDYECENCGVTFCQCHGVVTSEELTDEQHEFRFCTIECKADWIKEQEQYAKED